MRYNLKPNLWRTPSDGTIPGRLKELTPDVKTAIALLVRGAAEAHPEVFLGLSEDHCKLTPRNVKAVAILLDVAQKLFERTRDKKWIRVRKALNGIGYATK
jgi:hypothetical protein